MAEFLRSYLSYTFQSLTKYDYMAIGWILFLAFLLLILAAVVKRRTLSYTLLLFGLLLLFLGPPVVKGVMDRYLRAAEVRLTQTKVLQYSRSLVVEGEIRNGGKLDFTHCDLALVIYRPSSNLLKEAAAYLKPLAVRIVPLEIPIDAKESKPFRIIVDHFSTHDFNLTVQPRCYP
ncbi:DUF2393 family protein [Hydrogenimonas sp.]